MNNHKPKETKSFPSKIAAILILIGSYLFGGVSLLFWAIFLFRGSLNLIVFEIGEAGGLILNTSLSLLFFIQHSAMIRRTYRQWLEKYVRNDFHNALYAFFSGNCLLIVTIFWQKSSLSIINPEGIVKWLFHSLFL